MLTCRQSHVIVIICNWDYNYTSNVLHYKFTVLIEKYFPSFGNIKMILLVSVDRSWMLLMMHFLFSVQITEKKAALGWTTALDPAGPAAKPAAATPEPITAQQTLTSSNHMNQ